ncbi:zinc finger, RING/FYVE/PHD-type containing protein [Tanacetum coccineum]
MCNKKNQTILKLPSSRSFIVKHISYADQVIDVDPDFCGPEGLAGIKLSGTPFQNSLSEGYTFYNCSSANASFTFTNEGIFPLLCSGSVNHSVYAMETMFISYKDIPDNCKKITTISVPVAYYRSKRSVLSWNEPFCETCRFRGGTCEFKDGETTCIGSSTFGSSKDGGGGITRGAKYRLSIGIGVPTFIFVIGLICCLFGKVENYNHVRRQSIDLLSIAITPQPLSATGLARPTIESYPKAVLGESCELPQDGGTCAICLSDYKPKEEIRTIPDCNHYFHVDCIDEWLKLNVTCPVCRKSAQNSSLVTPCSSLPLNSTTSVDTPTQ